MDDGPIVVVGASLKAFLRSTCETGVSSWSPLAAGPGSPGGGDIGTLWADAAGEFPVIDAGTSGQRSVRLHGHTELYVSGYSGPELS